jgi:hypothetical protein
MAEWDIELGSDLIDGVKRLAARHYGEVSDASIAQVTEVALEMRLLWQEFVKGGESEIEETVVNWNFVNGESTRQLPAEIQGWLFRRR